MRRNQLRNYSKQTQMVHFMKKPFLKLHHILIPKVILCTMYIHTYRQMFNLTLYCNSDSCTKEKLHKIMALPTKRLHKNNCSDQTFTKSGG